MKNSMMKLAGFMAFATLLSKVLGLVREKLLANYYGTASELAAFLAATKLPILMFEMVLGGVISCAFIPVFNGYLEKKDGNAAFKFANGYINVVLIVTFLIMLIGLIFARPLISYLIPDADESTKLLGVQLSNIMMPMVMFTGLAFSFVGILQSFGRFSIPAIMSLVSNAVIIIYLFLFNERLGITGLAVAMLVGWMLQVAIQLPQLFKLGYRYKLTDKPDFSGLKSAAALAFPMLVSTWVQPIYSIAGMRFASYAAGDAGTVIFEFSNKLYIIVVGVFSFVVTNLFFPRLSRAGAADNRDQVNSLVAQSMGMVAYVILPITAFTMLYSLPLVQVLLQGGAFSADAAKQTAAALTCYSFGMLGMAFCEVLNKSFFSMHDSKTPMITSIVSIVLYVALGYYFSRMFGINGIASAAAVATSVNAVANLALMQRKQKHLFCLKDAWFLLKLALCAAVAGGASFVVKSLVANIYLQLMLGALVGALVYFALSHLLRLTKSVN